MTMTRTFNIVDLVTDVYLRDRRDHDVKEIADAAGVSQGTIRRRIEDERGIPVKGLQRSRVGTRNPTYVYGPTRAHLADLLAWRDQTSKETG